MASLICQAAPLTNQDVQVNAFDGPAALKSFLKVMRGCIKVCGGVNLQEGMQGGKGKQCICSSIKCPAHCEQFLLCQRQLLTGMCILDR